MTVNTDVEPYRFYNWNEYNPNLLTSNNWRASLVPAAAVIPAPIVYTKVVAFEKLVVGFYDWNELNLKIFTLANFC